MESEPSLTNLIDSDQVKKNYVEGDSGQFLN